MFMQLMRYNLMHKRVLSYHLTIPENLANKLDVFGLKWIFKFFCQHVSIAHYLRVQKICHLTLSSEAHILFFSHPTFQQLHLTPFSRQEILEFEILSSEKHFCHEKISQILFRPI